MTEPQVQSAEGWLDRFVEYLRQAIDIIQLKQDAIDRARADEEAFTMGVIIIALAGVGAAIGSLNPFGVVLFPILYVVFAFVGIGILHLIATVAFGGQGEFVRFFRPLSLAYVLTWVNVVWMLNVVLAPLAGIWMCVVAVVCVEREYGLDRPKAIAVVAIPVVVMLFLSMMLFAFVGAMAWMMMTAS